MYVLGDSPKGPVVKTLPSNARVAGLILVQGAKISQALWLNRPHYPCPAKKKQKKQKKKPIKQKQYCNKVIKDFLNGPHQKFFLKIQCTFSLHTRTVIL